MNLSSVNLSHVEISACLLYSFFLLLLLSSLVSLSHFLIITFAINEPVLANVSFWTVDVCFSLYL